MFILPGPIGCLAVASGIGLLIGFQRGWPARPCARLATAAVARGRFAADILLLAVVCLAIAGMALSATSIVVPA